MSDAALSTFERLFGPEFGHGKPFDTAPLTKTLEQLGRPEARLPRVIHVAGTNGKGSTIAFMRAIAEASGLRVHAFTKPHLLKLNERFLIAGEIVSDERLIEAAKRVAAVSTQLTQFDAQVAAALLMFADTPADITLIETGMGGRLDSTNVVSPALSVITPIALDHQDALGATIAEIAAHKAGIIKAGRPVVVARQSEEANRLIEAQAAQFNAPLYREGAEWDAFANAGRLVVQTETETFDLPLPALVGAHQVANAGLAVVSLVVADFAVSDDAFARGIADARWPARLQPLMRGPFSAQIRAAGGEVWVDAGHNAHATAALARWASAQSRKAPLVVIFGARARKDWAMALKALAIAAERVIAVTIDEGVAAEAIVEAARNESADAMAAPSLDAAMKNAAQLPAPRVLICGSFVLAAEALAAESA